MKTKEELEQDSKLAEHEAWLRKNSRCCLWCSQEAKVALWIREGVYTLHGIFFCEPCGQKRRYGLYASIGEPLKELTEEIVETRRAPWWFERPADEEDFENYLKRLRVKFPPPKRDPWPYRSTVGDVA